MAKQSDKKLIEKIQNQCMSLIDPKLNISKIYKSYNLLKLKDLIELSNWKFAHQFEQGSLPKIITESILYDHRNNSLIKSHQYKMRNKNINNLPQATHKLYRSSFLYQSLLKYTKLPSNIRQLTNHTAFSKPARTIC